MTLRKQERHQARDCPEGPPVDGDPAPLTTMTAHNDTPAEGQESTATQADWEGVARRLLADDLQQSADEVTVTFRRTATRIGAGEQLDESDVEEMIESLRQAYWLVESVAQASGEIDADDVPSFQGTIDADAE